MKYRLSLARDSRILELSKGEVTNFGRFNFMGKYPVPVQGGLFAAEIFGPTRNYTCGCGTYKETQDGSKCPDCGVAWVPTSVRKEWFGHIDCKSYYLHPFAVRIVGQVLQVGSKALNELMMNNLPTQLVETDNGPLQTKSGVTYRLDFNCDINSCHFSSINGMVEYFKEVGIDGELTLMMTKSQAGENYFHDGWSFYDFFSRLLVVNPPEMRPPMMVDENRVGYHTDNIIYTRVIREALRIEEIRNDEDYELNKEILDSAINYSASMIQRLINMLLVEGFDYGKMEVSSKLSNLLGKEGMLRQDNLGKRMDFSGRSVISSAPDIPIDSVKIPYGMLIELFKPEIIGIIHRELISKGVPQAKALLDAEKEWESKSPRIYDLVDELSKNQDVIMNRAPSLHRYSAMGHKVIPHSGKHIGFSPSACSPYNADNDGDTLAVHLPISDESKKEIAKFVHYHSNYKSSASFDKPNFALGHEAVVGGYLLTRGLLELAEIPVTYGTVSEICAKHELGQLKLDDTVLVRLGDGTKVKTCVGAVGLYEVTGILPTQALDKGGFSKYSCQVIDTYQDNEPELTQILTKMQKLYFSTATKYGLSLCYEDTAKSDYQQEVLRTARETVAEVISNRKSEEVRLLKLWNKGELDDKPEFKYDPIELPRIYDTAINHVVADWKEKADKDNSLVLMWKSGARVSDPQIRQMIVAKGLLTTMTGNLTEHAITHSLSDGLSPVEYLNTAGPARKGLANNYFLVPITGYAARQLVNLARDLTITSDDCGTDKGILLSKERALGHYTTDGELCTKEWLDKYEGDLVHVRSAITCEHNDGLCSKCCGINPANWKPWYKGFGIGVASSQSIAEPLTQAGLRGKHTSGAITLESFSKQLSATLPNLLKLLGSKGGMGVSLQDADVPSLHGLEGATYEEKASKLVQLLDEQFREVGVKLATVWYEVMVRALSDSFEEGGVTYLRSRGYRPNSEPVIRSNLQAVMGDPSWLKRLQHGYGKRVIQRAVENLEYSANYPSERMIQGELIHEFFDFNQE